MKPGSFTQIYIQLVFSPKYRDRLLRPDIRPEIFSYISGIITNRGHKSIIVNGVEDHIHIFIGLNPNDSISDLVAAIKKNSSVHINQQKWFRNKFHWQDGYGALSYSKRHVDRVYNYIMNQEAHHKKSTFHDEYISVLKKYEIEFEERYLFEFFQ